MRFRRTGFLVAKLLFDNFLLLKFVDFTLVVVLILLFDYLLFMSNHFDAF